MASRHPGATLAASICGSSLAFIDGSVVNVGLPLLARELHARPNSLSWAVNAYALPLGALLLLGGGLGDRYGRRRVFNSGLLLFTLASIICSLAPSFGWLLAGRAMQGVGAALLMPNSLALLGGAFDGEERGRAIGTWAGVGALSGAIGPVLGGWLIDAVGWRSVFYINVPIAGVAGFLALRFVEEQRDAAAARSLDYVGAILATLALALLIWALTASSGSDVPRAVIRLAAVAGVVTLACFSIWEYRLGDAALVPFSVFSSQAFVGLNALTWFLYGALGGLIVLVPFLLIQVEHWSALQAGAALLPIPVIIGLGSRFMGRYAQRVGVRTPLTVGCLLVAVGLALYARIGAQPVDYWRLLFTPTLLLAIGMGICVAPLTSAVMSAVDQRYVGLASGINNAVARLAGLVATASLGFVFAAQNVRETFVHSVRVAALVGAAAAVLAALFAFAMLRNLRDNQRH